MPRDVRRGQHRRLPHRAAHPRHHGGQQIVLADDPLDAGAYTGVWTATEATGTAVGPYVYAAVLAAAGFVSTAEGTAVAQTDPALRALLWGFTALPAVLMGAALLFQQRYGLDRAAGRISAPSRTPASTTGRPSPDGHRRLSP
ncbi:MFS transporter [Streptomyces sp. NPDC050145]|uniref:MFS transporter n=1 Tax=Streptomyces sp. NPDC050145 TaxID=3365602 RepID=UPI003794CF32